MANDALDELTLPEGIAPGPIAAFLAAHVPELGALRGATLIGGGRSNLTYRLQLEHGSAILRRPPLGHILPSAHDMVRESRFIRGLAGRGIPLPRVLAVCDESDLIGQPFYLMEDCPGVVVSGAEWPASLGGDDARSATCESMVRTLAAIHAADWQDAGLGDFARPGSFIERQLKRLSDQYERSVEAPDPAMAELRRRLEAARPAHQDVSVVHGDFGLHNVLLSEQAPGVITAVLDWEMAAIGNPLADLGWLMALWSKGTGAPGEQPPPGTRGATALPGFWTRSEMAARYGEVSGRDVSGVDYYYLLGLYKLVVIWAGIDARFRAGVTRGEGFEQYGRWVSLGIERAMAVADGSSIAALRG